MKLLYLYLWNNRLATYHPFFSGCQNNSNPCRIRLIPSMPIYARLTEMLRLKRYEKPPTTAVHLQPRSRSSLRLNAEQNHCGRSPINLSMVRSDMQNPHAKWWMRLMKSRRCHHNIAVSAARTCLMLKECLIMSHKRLTILWSGRYTASAGFIRLSVPADAATVIIHRAAEVETQHI